MIGGIAWIVALNVAYFAVWFTRPKRIGNGFSARPFKRIVKSRSVFGGIGRYLLRYYVWMMLGWIALDLADWLFWLGAFAFLADDWFFGDEDERKRKWQQAKNKIKWLMELPVPQPFAPGTA